MPGPEIPVHPLLDPAVVSDWWSTADVSLRTRFATYVAEAVFAEQVLSDAILRIPRTSTVFEIGSGIGLLGRLMAQHGHRLVMYEPGGTGFSTMRVLSQLVSDAWIGPPVELEARWQAFNLDQRDAGTAALVVAFNVIEHAPSPAYLVAEATRLLSPDGLGRFICPNYAFPYEPHFGMPTLFRKDLTFRVMRARVVGNGLIAEPESFWDDLSWPTTRSLHEELKRLGVDHRFGRGAALAYVGRLVEPTFLARKGSVMGLLAQLQPAVRSTLRLVPTSLLPITDLTTRRGFAS